jgi:hypothetical protein
MYFYPCSNHPSAIYLFKYEVKAETLSIGLKKIKPTLKLCETFADALQIHCCADHVGAVIDDAFSIRLIFNIKEPQESILVKVASLFAFAAATKLTLINQFFYSK